jgi:hypothetical protein
MLNILKAIIKYDVYIIYVFFEQKHIVIPLKLQVHLNKIKILILEIRNYENS